MKLINGEKKISKLSAGDSQDFIVTIIGEKFHETFAEELHV